jgi:hypothetical protein
MMLGIANGFGAACYLLAVYHFMATVVPRLANRAFLLFSFSGGLGGLLYIACSALGVTETPTFSQSFYRFAMYDLVEGQYLAPYLLMPRLYYTLPLALGFAGLTSLIVSWRIRCPIHLIYSQVLLLLCALINARLGPPLALIALLYLAQQRELRWKYAFHAAAPLAVGVLCATQIMKLNPTFTGNVYAVVQQQMWLTAFLSAASPLLLLAIPVMGRDAINLMRGFRAIVYGVLGYLVVYTLLFFFYQAYYGTLLTGADHAASVRVSDISLVGIIFGLLWHAKRKSSGETSEHGWLIVWAALFIAVAISAFGQGWFLRFAPQRLMVFLGIPLSMLAAESLAGLENAQPRLARAAMMMVFAIGLPSLAVSTLVFQGPLGMRAGLASDIGMHAAYLRRADAECLEQLGPGVVAAPWPYNDILSLREGSKVIGGYGAVGLSDQGSGALDAEVKRFFALSTSDEQRRGFLKAWCVAYVYLPSDARDRDLLAASLGGMAELTELHSVGGARLYQVL